MSLCYRMQGKVRHEFASKLYQITKGRIVKLKFLLSSTSSTVNCLYAVDLVELGLFSHLWRTFPMRTFFTLYIDPYPYITCTYNTRWTVFNGSNFRFNSCPYINSLYANRNKGEKHLGCTEKSAPNQPPLLM